MLTAAIIQARMASTRLPGKVMADLKGKPLIHHVVDRARRARFVDLVLVVTSDRVSDDRLAAYCTTHEIPCVRGNQDDVLDRYHRAAHAIGADVIVRLTADCPLLDPMVIDEVVAAFRAGQFDYLSNTLKPTFPDGLDAEVFSIDALDRAWSEARLGSEREHVTAYIWKHPDRFRLGDLQYPEDLSKLRWTVDEPQDLEFVRGIYFHLANGSTSMTDVLGLLRDHPELVQLNQGFARNEGYAKSLRADEAAAGGGCA
jgi:spore coat polysaccharide biosynthesis protein SpsF